MRRWPVEPPARGASEEALVRRPYEGRDAIACPLPWHLLEQPVALEAAPGEHFEGGERVRFTPDRADKRREGGSEVGVAGGETLERAELRQVEEVAEQTRVVGREKPTAHQAAARERRGGSAQQLSAPLLAKWDRRRCRVAPT